MVAFTRFIFTLAVFVVLGACGMDDNNRGDWADNKKKPEPQETSDQLAYYYGHYQMKLNPIDADSKEFVIRLDIEDKQPQSMHLKQLSPTSVAEKITLQCQQLVGYRCAGKDSHNHEFKFEFFAWDDTFELHNFWVSLTDRKQAWVTEHTTALTAAKIRATHFSDTEASKSVTQMQKGDLFTKWSADLCPHLQKSDSSYEYGLKNDSCANRNFVFGARAKFIRFALTHGIGCALDGNDFKLEFTASDNSHSFGCDINSVSSIDGDDFSKGEGGMGITVSHLDAHMARTNEKYLWMGKNGKWDGRVLTDRTTLDDRIGRAIPHTSCLLGLCTPPW